MNRARKAKRPLGLHDNITEAEYRNVRKSLFRRATATLLRAETFVKWALLEKPGDEDMRLARKNLERARVQYRAACRVNSPLDTAAHFLPEFEERYKAARKAIELFETRKERVSE